jgi:ketosteroid isomerase-like protein
MIWIGAISGPLRLLQNWSSRSPPSSAQTEVSTPETTMNQDHAYIHREWHRAASMRDLPALLALYADDATLESPLVPSVLNDKSDGVLRGKAEIAHFLETALAAAASTSSAGTGRMHFSATGQL